MLFIKGAPNSHGFVNPRDIELLWRDQFDWVYRELDYAVFPLTIHPDVSGRPQVLLMLERLIAYIGASRASAGRRSGRPPPTSGGATRGERRSSDEHPAGTGARPPIRIGYPTDHRPCLPPEETTMHPAAPPLPQDLAPPAIAFADVQRAAERLKGVARRTPVLTSTALDERTGATVFVKAENQQRVGAFKFRGAYNAVAALDPEIRIRGVVTASSGNHAQAVALAAKLHGVPAWIVMPEDAPAVKLAATRGYGAEVIPYDRYSGDRVAISRRVAEERGATLIPPYDHPDVMAGQGTLAMELIGESARSTSCSSASAAAASSPAAPSPRRPSRPASRSSASSRPPATTGPDPTPPASASAWPRSRGPSPTASRPRRRVSSPGRPPAPSSRGSPSSTTGPSGRPWSSSSSG
jgi:hypothetical protein